MHNLKAKVICEVMGAVVCEGVVWEVVCGVYVDCMWWGYVGGVVYGQLFLCSCWGLCVWVSWFQNQESILDKS